MVRRRRLLRQRGAICHCTGGVGATNPSSRQATALLAESKSLCRLLMLSTKRPYCRPVKDLSPRIHRCPERPGCAAQRLAQPAQLPDPVIHWDQTRQTRGRDVSRKQNNERRRGRWSQTVIERETSPADTENVFVLIGASVTHTPLHP